MMKKTSLDMLIGQEIQSLDFACNKLTIDFKNKRKLVFNDCLFFYETGICNSSLKDYYYSENVGVYFRSTVADEKLNVNLNDFFQFGLTCEKDDIKSSLELVYKEIQLI